MIIDLQLLPSSLFTFANGQLTARVSQIMKHDPTANECPRSFGIEFSSGKIALFKYDSSRLDAVEGQVISWGYVPTEDAVREVPELSGAVLTIRNN